jgi:lateral signaling target protein 2
MFSRFSFFFLQADDKSLLARFYHADRSLTAVASELDSFDGRAEPERCSRLVGKLRQGQVSCE